MQDNIKKAVLPKNEDISKPKFNIGDKVRLKVQRGENQKSNGRNWTQEIYTIYKRGVPKTNTSAPFYMVEDDNKIYTDRLYNNDLQLANVVEHQINVDQKYNISKIIKPVMKRVNGKYEKFYEVAWKGYRKQSDNTQEPRDKLLIDIPKLLRLWEEEHEVDWGKTTVKYRTIKDEKKGKNKEEEEEKEKEKEVTTRRGRRVKSKPSHLS